MKSALMAQYVLIIRRIGIPCHKPNY